MLVPKERIHCFVASTARRWDFGTRVTLYNHTGEPAYADVLVREADGTPIVRVTRIAELPDGRSRLFDVPSLFNEHGLPPPIDDHVLTFSIVPRRFEDAPGPVEIEKSEVFRLLTAQDHYVEHYDPDTLFSSGVLYQTPPLNDRLLGAGSSFIMQAPKVFLTPERNTVFQVLYHTSDPEFATQGTMLCRLRRGDGTPLLAWSETATPHGMHYIDVKEVLQRHGLDWAKVVGAHGFLFFEACAPDVSFIPLTININEVRRTFDLEHSLPPIYYGSDYGGARKKQAIATMVASFAAPAVTASASRRPST